MIVIGLVASPGPAADLAQSLLTDLHGPISGRLPDGEWQLQLAVDRLVDAPADLSRLVAAARRRLLDEGWQMTICITDLPLATQRRPVVAHASATHAVAVLSLPALGAVGVTRRAADAVVRLVEALLGEADGQSADLDDHDRRRRRVALYRRTRELNESPGSDSGTVGLITGVLTGNLRLLLGMLRANRPWRLVSRLSRALVAALAVDILALVTSDIWRLANALGPVRLSVLTVGSVLAVVLSLVLGAGLWERVPPGAAGPGIRQQVALFNIVTILTVVIGAAALYGALVLLTAVGVLVMVPAGLIAAAVGHSAGLGDQVQLAWLASSLGTLGGALGAGLESDEAVREAAYRYQPDNELSADR
ncbi:MAG: hypothetical protein HOV83_19815 [Catenulispora sp.]|nr:hypothetical protein [Catenulispora sp.]